MLRIKTVLCPIDFSEFSKHAFDCAVAIARSHAGNVVALHVPPIPTPHGAIAIPFGPEGPGPFVLQHVDREKLVEEMKRFLATGAEAAGVPVRFEVAEAPSAYREILVQVGRVGADLIVMGTHGRSGFERLLLGSTTEKVLRRSPVPVLTVPSRTEDVRPTTGFHRIVCGVDFSAVAATSVHYASALAEEGHARLTLLHVVEMLPVVYEPTMATPFDVERDRPALEDAAREQLHRFVPDAIRQRGEVEELVTSGKPYAEILRLAAERRADLIVLGVHGHNVLDTLLFGSTTAHVVRRAACPVLTVREPSGGR